MNLAKKYSLFDKKCASQELINITKSFGIMKRKQDSISFVIHNFTILSLVIAIPLLFLINNTTDVVGGQQTLQNTVPKSAPPGIPSITKVNTTGQAASQNAESLIRSIMDPASLMSTVMNATGGNNKTQSSNVGPSHLKNSGSENNLTNTSTDLLNTVTNRSSGSVNKNNIDNNNRNQNKPIFCSKYQRGVEYKQW